MPDTATTPTFGQYLEAQGLDWRAMTPAQIEARFDWWVKNVTGKAPIIQDFNPFWEDYKKELGEDIAWLGSTIGGAADAAKAAITETGTTAAQYLFFGALALGALYIVTR